MRVEMVQSNPGPDKKQNLQKIGRAVETAVSQGAQVVVLPEMFAFMGDESGRLNTADQLGQGVFAELSELAKKHGVHLIGGSHAELPNTLSSGARQKVFNTSQAFSPQGDVLSTYRKLHLFNLRNEAGQSEFRESDHFLAGAQPEKCFEIEIGQCRWNALTLICYDLRFPEIFRLQKLNQKPPDVVFLPAAFTFRTGQAHWEILLRARAIENQCYLVACNQTGYFCGDKKRNYGHSMVVSPWGEILCEADEAECVTGCDLNLEDVVLARKQIPALENRIIF